MCCRSGWPIPVEAAAHRRITRGLAEGRITLERTPASGLKMRLERLLPPRPDQPEEALSLLGQDEHGACLFLEVEHGNLCAIHRQAGPGTLASACRQFPRVAVLTPRGVFITLSHYCPTAAALLFRKRPPEIRRNPPAFPPDGSYEGLEARGELPPLLRPDALMCWDSYGLWEQHAVATLARDELSPEEALCVLAECAERVRAWSANQGGLLPLVRRILAERREARAVETEPRHLSDAERVVSIFDGVTRTVPRSLAAQVERARMDGYARWVEPAWARLAGPIRRYLAAKAFASWPAHEGQGLRTAVFSLVVALAVLRVQTARLCQEARAELDEARLLEAFRASDRLLVHLCSPRGLTRWYSSFEIRDSRRGWEA